MSENEIVFLSVLNFFGGLFFWGGSVWLLAYTFGVFS